MYHKFPKIRQFKDVVYTVKQHSKQTNTPLPTLTFVGTVKLHGTNASVVQLPDGQIKYQSRNNVLDGEADNCGFKAYMQQSGIISKMMQQVRQYFKLGEFDGTIVVYGEFIGQGIQNGVAIANLEKHFVPFAIRHVEANEWLCANADLNEVFKDTFGSIYRTRQYIVTVDMTTPSLQQNTFHDLTMQVEAECPYAKQHGISGTGEGIVWRCITPEYESSVFWFKTKGNKHSASKVKKVASVDIDKIKSIHELVDTAVTENRLQQGLDYLTEMNLPHTVNSTGAFIGWMVKDVLAEEALTIESSMLNTKEVSHYIATKARQFYLDKVSCL